MNNKKNVSNDNIGKKNINIGLMFGVSFLVLVFFSMFSMMYNIYGYNQFGSYGMFGMMSYFPGMMVFGMLFMLLITAVLVLLIAWLWKQLKN